MSATTIPDDASSLDEQDYQTALSRDLFRNPNKEDDEEDDDDGSGITRHSWTSVNPNNPEDSITLTYHLALLAPGHGDSVWNAGVRLAECFLWNPRELLPESFAPSLTLEVGAGAALPSLALLHAGAKRVIMADMVLNNSQVLQALRTSVEVNKNRWKMDPASSDAEPVAKVVEHTWGKDLAGLREHCHSVDTPSVGLVVASDCIYNPNYHRDLLRSIQAVLSHEDGIALVSYSMHSNVPPDQVEAFFEMAQTEFSLQVISESTKRYSEQVGIGSSDPDRAVVYVKVLAYCDSKYHRKSNK